MTAQTPGCGPNSEARKRAAEGAVGSENDYTPTQIVALQYDAFLSSPSLDPAWIAGWHAAIKHTVAALAQHGPAPDCRCSAGNDLPFPSQHATLCPRFVHWETVVNVMRTAPERRPS